MTYFNPRIFNKNNLKEEDRKELDYWNDVFVNLIENERDDFIDDTTLIGKMKKEIIDEFCDNLRQNLGVTMQEQVVSIIDNYEDDVEEVDDPDTYFYEGEEND